MKKSKYDEIEIPQELSSVVYDAIETGLNGKTKKYNIVNRIGLIAAGLIAVFIIPLNLNQAYAETLSQIPIIRDISKLFTFREYQFEDDIQYVDVKIPQFSNEGKTDLEKRVNEEIIKTINEEVENSKQRAKEYYDAFIETGGNPEEFMKREIEVNYEIKCVSDKYVSFVINKWETWANAYCQQYFYNLDMETGRELTLKDLLGNDYKEIVMKSINNSIENWSEEQKFYLFDEVNIEDLINENTKFYLNDQQQVVIVFGKYEIAAGAAGIIEFPITNEEQ